MWATLCELRPHTHGLHHAQDPGQAPCRPASGTGKAGEDHVSEGKKMGQPEFGESMGAWGRGERLPVEAVEAFEQAHFSETIGFCLMGDPARLA